LLELVPLRECVVEPLLVRDQHCHRDVVGDVGIGEHLRPVGELRNHLRLHEARDLEPLHACPRQQLDQAHLLRRPDDLRLVLEPVPRSDLANVDVIAHAYIMPRPPLTPIVSPVTNDASSDARYATAAATSSGRPIRPSAVLDTIPLTSRSPSSPRCSGAAIRRGVSIGPGAIALQRTL